MLKLHHWLVCLLLMNVPVYGMESELPWDDGMAHRSMYGGFNVERRITGYEDYKKEIESRINQGLKGLDLIKAYKQGFCDILTRCVSEACPDLLQRLIDYDPSIKNSDEFHGALSASVWKKNLELTKWFIVNGAHVDFNDGDALREAANKNIQSIVILLLMHNANPNLCDGYGSTALHGVVMFMFRSSHILSNFSTEQAKRDMVRLLIIGGTDISLRTHNNCGFGSGYNEKTAIEIVCREQKFKLAQIIKQTALQRDNLFAAVARGENIPFRTNPEDSEALKNWISLRHARTIHGDNLLHCAFTHKNAAVAQKLFKFWPQLLAQPNFKGETVLYLFPQRCIELLSNPNSGL